MDQSDLVPERECGACMACCSVLAIVEDGMSKPPAVDCEHCIAGGGCAIYATRPGVCRTYFCGWRRLIDLDESWRPDLSGVLIGFEDTPGAAHGDSRVDLVVIGGEAAARSDHFAGLAASFVEGGAGTFFVLPPGPNLVPHNIQLNALLAEAVAARSLERVKAVIADCYELLREQAPVPANRAQPGLVRTVQLAPRTTVKVSWS
jgi:hypothetical protein